MLKGEVRCARCKSKSERKAFTVGTSEEAANKKLQLQSDLQATVENSRNLNKTIFQ